MGLINQRRLLHLNSGSARAVGAWVLLVPRGGLSVHGWGTTTMGCKLKRRGLEKKPKFDSVYQASIDVLYLERCFVSEGELLVACIRSGLRCGEQ